MNDRLPGLRISLSFFLGMLFFSFAASGQNSQNQPVAYNFGEGAGITSNVPLNEINIHAFRHFRRRWPAVTGETWCKADGGYMVSFKEKSLRCQARFDARGGFQYSLKYYAGKDVSPDLSGLIRIKYPDYRIDVVTEVNNNEKTFYLVKIENSSSVKALSISEGRMEVYEELINGGVRPEAGK